MLRGIRIASRSLGAALGLSVVLGACSEGSQTTLDPQRAVVDHQDELAAVAAAALQAAIDTIRASDIETLVLDDDGMRQWGLSANNITAFAKGFASLAEDVPAQRAVGPAEQEISCQKRSEVRSPPLCEVTVGTLILSPRLLEVTGEKTFVLEIVTILPGAKPGRVSTALHRFTLESRDEGFSVVRYEREDS